MPRPIFFREVLALPLPQSRMGPGFSAVDRVYPLIFDIRRETGSSLIRRFVGFIPRFTVACNQVVHN